METLRLLYDELEIAERAKKDYEFALHSLGDASAMVEIAKCDDLIVVTNRAITEALERIGRVEYAEAYRAFVTDYMSRFRMKSFRAAEEMLESGGRKQAFDVHYRNGLKLPEILHLIYEKNETQRN